MQNKNVLATALCAGILSLGLLASQAQTTANYIGPASGGEWNTAANWDTTAPPGADVNATTNAFIGAGTNVSYNLPMTAPGFGILTNSGVLNINTNGFNCSAITMIIPTGGDRLFITNSGSVVNINGGLTMGTNANALLAGGATLNVGSLVLDANTSSHGAGTSALTNNGGFLTANSTTINNNQGTGTGLLLINGGTNNLGNTAVGRNNSGAGGATLGTEGLVINNGVVTMTNLNLGNAGNGLSSLSAYITGGIVTNIGSVSINQGSSGRFSRLLQTGGLFVVPDPGVANPNPTVSGSLNNYTVNGGTNIVGGFYFGNSNATPGTVNFTNAGTIYIGSQGINWSGSITLNTFLRPGGLFGATADWTGLTTLGLAGTGNYTIQTADVSGTAHNVTLSGAISGPSSMSLTKTGNGTLTFTAANTYSGNTTINNGTLTLGAGGSLASTLIVVGPGTTFDVSALAGAYTPVTAQTLSGFGLVNGLVTATAGTIQPGSNNVTGTLTLAGGLTESGGAANKFILSNDPINGSNDLLSVTGDLTVSGANNVAVVGSLPNGVEYALMKYTGNFNGSVANFTLSGVTGYLTNITASKSIVLHTLATTRGPANIVWVGNPVNNFWDTAVTTNWLNAGVLDFFITGDSVLFNATGAAVTNVNITASVAPASTTVDATTNYFFTGNGSIDGIGGLTKTNSGTLTILTTNTYTGVTTVNGGVLEVYQLANSLSASSIGAADNGSGNLVISNGTFRYAGPSVTTDRGATLASTASTIDVTINGSLAIGGAVAGNGGLTKIDNGTLILGSANSYTGNTAINGGVLQLNDAGAASTGTINFSNGTLTYSPSAGLNIVNPFNFAAGTSNTIVVTSGSGGNPLSGGAWSGSGIVDINNTFSPYTVNGVLDAFTGTILLTTPNGSQFRLNSGGGNTCFGSTNATFDLGNGTAVLTCRNAGAMNLGALQGDSGTFVQGQGTGAGTVTWTIGNNNLSTTFSGIIKNNAANEISAITKVGTGTLTLAGQSTYTGTTTVSNGVLALAFNPTNTADGSISSSAQINILPGTFLDVSARSDQTLPLASGQQLRGRGTLNGILDTTGGGMVAPGGGPGGSTGTLTVTNRINLGGSAWMKVNRTNSLTSDHLVSSLSTITYGGTLVVTNIGPALQPGDTFTLFVGGGLSTATFSTIILPGYYTWDTSNLGVNGSVTVTSILSGPSFSAADFSQLVNGSITLNATNGSPNGPVIVLTTTNVALPLASWTPIATNTFNNDGTLSQPVTVDPNLPQSFFVLQGF